MTTMNLTAQPRPARDRADDTGASWLARGACGDEDPELFFPVGYSNEQTMRAKAVCHRCPVMAECYEWNVGVGSTSGVWGGTSEYDRGEPKRRKEYERQTATTADGLRLALEHGEDIIVCHLLESSEQQLTEQYGVTPAAVRCALRILMPQTEVRKGCPALEKILVGAIFQDLVAAGRPDQEIALMMRTQAPVVVEARRVLEHRAAAVRRVVAGRTEEAAVAEGGAL